jgi:hypothetical protein
MRRLYSGVFLLFLFASCGSVKVPDDNFPPMGDAVAEEESFMTISTIKSLAAYKDNNHDPFFEEHFGKNGTFANDTVRERETLSKNLAKKPIKQNNVPILRQCRENTYIAYQNKSASLPCKDYLANYQMSCYGNRSTKACQVLLKVTNNCFEVSQCAQKGIIDLNRGQALAFNLTGRAATFEDSKGLKDISVDESISPCMKYALNENSLSNHQKKFYNKFCKCACKDSSRNPAGYFTMAP